MGNQLDITNVVSVSLSNAPRGIGEYNVNNIALFTNENFGQTFWDLDFKIYLNPREVALDFGSDSLTYRMALAIFSQTPNILNGSGYLVVVPLIAASGDIPAETLENAIIRASSLVQFYGILTTKAIDEAEFQNASDYTQSVNKLYFEVGTSSTLFAPDGLFDVVRAKGNTHTRCLSYLSDLISAKKMAAAYAGRALSVNHSASRSTITMHLKDLATIDADPNMSQTYLNQCKDAGVDVYVNIAGVSKVFTSGANKFFDQIYNIGWFVGAIEVAGFNLLATVSTKVSQTEEGMSLLKGAYRLVCERSVNNAFVAPGQWNSADRFGDVEAMLRNIEEAGYYIYSEPVNQQAQTEREERKAPVCQIAIKEAGAIHSTNIIIYVNA
ncbi:MAG: DUF3383 domain-containing protein [Elusimicrobiota bacterium]|jgi:hypothetical protein|nr:DUF3383 domain-containing protein [Elusimicrobiota bacterium]